METNRRFINVTNPPGVGGDRSKVNDKCIGQKYGGYTAPKCWISSW